MGATQGMDKSIPIKSVNSLSMTGSSVVLLQPGCGEKQDYSGAILECLNKECKATCALSGSEAFARRNS